MRAPLYGLLLALLMAGCASRPSSSSLPTSTPPSPSTSTAPARPAAPGPTTPAGSPPSFEQVTQGARREPGWLPLWRRQDKVWLELSAQHFERPLFLSPKLASGLGEAGLLGGLMQSRSGVAGRPQWVEFRRLPNQQIQLLAMNPGFEAGNDAARQRAVSTAYSPSLVASWPPASAPHPRSGAVLVDVSTWLLSDWMGLGPRLQQAYRQGHALDVRNSQVLEVRAQEGSLILQARLHFASNTINAVVDGGARPPGAPAPLVPGTVPDPRSLFLNTHFTLSPLPEQPMARRPADPRVGYFSSTVLDFANQPTTDRRGRQRFIHRWRLEPVVSDRSGATRPRQPITFWLDPSIPVAYRPAVRDGVLAWNEAFAAIGLPGALEVREASESDADTLQTQRASIRWMTNARPAFSAIGPSHVDPRSGEILDADIGIEGLPLRTMQQWPQELWGPHAHEADTCQHAALAQEQLGLGLAWLDRQGHRALDDPQVQTFIQDYLKSVTMHEVGHALGLRHNFKASRWKSAADLQHPLKTRQQGLAASVMDYLPINLPATAQPARDAALPIAPAPFQTRLGPYDHWAIAYGYSPLPADATAAQAQLKALAARADQPEHAQALAYATDEDQLLGLDPHALMFDLGDDAVQFARRRGLLVRELIDRAHAMTRTPMDPAAGPQEAGAPRRWVAMALRETQRNAQVLLRQVGGLVVRRVGPTSTAPSLEPTPAPQQRAALALLLSEHLRADVWQLQPALLQRLAPNALEVMDEGLVALARTDVSVAEQQLALQRPILTQLMSPQLATRLQDNAEKLPATAQALSFADVLEAVSQTVWPGADRAPHAAPWRRQLQRTHVQLLAQALWGSDDSRANVRADVRLSYVQHARTLLSWLKQQEARSPADRLEQQHLRDSIRLLEGALDAPWVRAGA